VITKWISSINGEPGLLKDVFIYLEANNKKARLKKVALAFEAMTFRKQLIYYRKRGKMAGNVDFGRVAEGDKICE